MESIRIGHFRHHSRFYASVLCGVATWLVPYASAGARTSISGTVFFVIYLASTALLAREVTVEDLRKKASMEDEGIFVIVLITLAVIALSIGSLVVLLESGAGNGWRLVPALANVPLGWATLHTIMAFHYAHLFYSPPGEMADKDEEQVGGLSSPGQRNRTLSTSCIFLSWLE